MGLRLFDIVRFLLLTQAQIIMFLVFLGVGIFKPPFLLFIMCKKAFFRIPNTPELHAKKVKRVQEQILDWIRNGKKTKLCSGRPWWQSVSVKMVNHKKGMTGINMAELDDVIEVDTKRQVVRVEPMTSMGKLSKRLINFGWTIPVIPEFKFLSVGGLINGYGIETSSHKYGLFCHACVEFEIVLADGRIVHCSKEENSDLFHSIPMSHGTLGFLTAATIKMIPAKKYVKLEYIAKKSLDGIVNEFTKQISPESGNDFVEGFMFGLDKAVIMVGNMASQPQSNEQVNSIGRWYKPWFHTHAKTYLEKSTLAKHVEYIPLRDYIHRHDKTLFWTLDNGIPFANNVIYRYLLGWILPLDPTLMKRMAGPMFSCINPESVKSIAAKLHICQDYVIPIEKLKTFLQLADKEVKVYPTWLCGQLDPNWPGMINYGGKMLVDVGLYGERGNEADGQTQNPTKTFEEFCLKNGGYYGTYSDTYMTREEFQKMFNHDLYFKVRKELGCSDVFPEVFDKASAK